MITMPAFEYHEGFLPGGNDLMTVNSIEEAMSAAASGDAIGFTWNGDREPTGCVSIWVKVSTHSFEIALTGIGKDVNCSRKTGGSAADGWHTMLKREHLVYHKSGGPVPEISNVSSEQGVWPAECLAALARAGDSNIGFSEDPLDAVLEASLARPSYLHANMLSFAGAWWCSVCRCRVSPCSV